MHNFDVVQLISGSSKIKKNASNKFYKNERTVCIRTNGMGGKGRRNVKCSKMKKKIYLSSNFSGQIKSINVGRFNSLYISFSSSFYLCFCGRWWVLSCAEYG